MWVYAVTEDGFEYIIDHSGKRVFSSNYAALQNIIDKKIDEINKLQKYIDELKYLQGK